MSDNHTVCLENDNAHTRSGYLLLLLIILVGAGLRFFQLGQESLWLDEAASGLRAQMTWSELFNKLTAIKGNPPLHYILLKVWTDWFGHSEFSLRFLSALFSVLSLVVFYHLARLLVSEKAALLSAALLALSRYHIDFAQEARCYALLGFLVLLSMYYFIRLWQRSGWTSYGGYIAASVAMLYTHYYAPFILIAQNCFLLTVYVCRKPVPWKLVGYWIAIQAVIGVCYLPWASVLWQAIHKMQTVPTILHTPGWRDFLACFKAFAGNRAWAAVVFWVPAGLSVYGVWKKGARSVFNASGSSKLKAYILLWVWLMIPMVLPFAYSVFRSPIFSSRYTLISSYALYLLMAVGIFSVRNRAFRYVLIAAVLLTSVRVLAPRYFFHNFEQWRQATAYIESKAEPGQPLLFHAPFCGNVGYRFYAKRSDLRVLGFPWDAQNGYAVTDKNITQLDTLLDGYPAVWLILAHSRDKQGLILQYLRDRYQQKDHASFVGIEVYLFVKKK